jgi:hypothetical protein
MPDKFRIDVQADAAIIRSSSHGRHPIACPITVHIGDRCFPHPDWDDFALTILEWWFQAVAELRGGNTRTANLLFMDGPLMIRLTARSADLWGVECVREGKNSSTVEVFGECDPGQISSEITKALDQVLAGVRQAGLWSDDCSKLEMYLAESRQP